MTSFLKPVPSLHKELMLDKVPSGVGEPVLIGQAKRPTSLVQITRNGGALVAVEPHEAVPLVVSEISPNDHVKPLCVERLKDTTPLHLDGRKQSIKNWALDYGITPNIIIARLERGMSIADAITQPMRVAFPGQQLPIFSRLQRGEPSPQGKRRKARYTFNGMTMTLDGWARLTGIRESTLKSRLQSNWPIALALTTPSGAHRGRYAERAAGVASDFAPSEGTGAGSTAQETSKITFSEKA